MVLNEKEGLVLPFHVLFSFPLLWKTQLSSTFCVISHLCPLATGRGVGGGVGGGSVVSSNNTAFAVDGAVAEPELCHQS